jgi:uncharacterized protein YjbI with pentapeptide repeats
VRVHAGQAVDCGPKLVANPEHLKLLRQGVDVWNEWRAENPSAHPDLVGANLSGGNLDLTDLSLAKEPSIHPDLGGANLSEANLDLAGLSLTNLSLANLVGANLIQATLVEANLSGANLSGANLRRADFLGANLGGAAFVGAFLFEANLVGADLVGADLSGANLNEATLNGANLVGANLSGARLSKVILVEANLSGANLNGADLVGADLNGANLNEATLVGANLNEATVVEANLSGANLRRADLTRAQLVETNLVHATLTDCRIYGIAAWNVRLSAATIQQGLIVTPEDEPAVTIDDLEVAQFVYLLLHNDKIRRVIDTVGRKGVLLLGRFTESRIAVLERLRDELRKRDYLPIVFNFDKPETKDFTETVRLLVGLSKFVIVDLTSPKSAPYELGQIVSQTMIPFKPIIDAVETPFAMLQDLWINYPDRVFQPLYYSSPDALIAALDEKIIRPAEARFVELVRRKGEAMGGEHV